MRVQTKTGVQNQKNNTDVGYVVEDSGQPLSSGLGSPLESLGVDAEALSMDPGALSSPPPNEPGIPPKKNLFVRIFKRADVIVIVILLAGVAGLLLSTARDKQKTPTASVASQYTTQQIPLSGFIATNQGIAFGPSNVVINGSLKVSDGIVIVPTVQPQNSTTGQLYYDKNTNQLAYYNGQQYVSLTQQGQVVQSIGGVTGALTLGGGLSVVGNQLSVTQNQNVGVSSLGGVTGALTVGNGLKITGTDLQNSGVVSLTAGTPNLIVASDGSGNLTISSVGGGSGTVTSGGGTIGRIAKFTGVQNVEDSLLSESGGTVTVNGNLSITGSLALTTALSVANGGTGTTALTNNGVLVGQGGGAIASVTAGAAGLCLMSNAGAPSFQACPGGAGAAVTSLNGLTGGLTIANATAGGSTVTINDATATGTKGIANFNATNFSVAGGAVNTIQNINTGATPTFAGVNTNSITPSGAFTAGATGQAFTLQGNGLSIITATNGASTSTISFQTPTANVNYRFATAAAGNYDICTTIGNCVGSGGGVTTAGGTTNAIPKFSGAQTLTNSNISDNGSLVTISGNASITGSLTLGTALGVGQGGTGAVALTSNGVVIGQGAGALTTVTAGGAGLCFLSTVGAPAFAACPTGGVTSLNGLTGALSIANASGLGSTVTINDATTGAKGIASFNATNFTVTSGAVNTIQDITTTAAPTFGQLAITSSQASNPMLLINNTNGGASGNLLDLQVSGSSKFSVQPNGNATTAGTINGQTISAAASFTGTLAVAGNTTLTGDIAVNGGDITSAGALNITPGGALTVGAATQTLALQGGSASSFAVTNGGNTTTVNFQAPTANVTYRFATAAAGSYDICTTVGNCAGTGGGVTTAGGSTNRLAKFTAGQIIGDSTISDNGTTVTTTANLTVQGGTLTAGVANTQTGSLTLAYGSANFSGTVTPGALTATRTYTLPDASGTFCLNGASSCGFATGSGAAFVQGGNSFAAAADLGTNDGNALNLRTNGVTQVSISSAGNTTFSGDVAVNGGDITSSGALNITPGGALTVGNTGQTLALQGGSGSTLKAVNGGNATTVNFQAPTANVTYRFATTAAGTYDICSTAGNCAGSGSGVTTGGGTTNRLAKFTGSQAINDSTISDNGTTVTTTANMVIQGGTGTIGVAGTTNGSLTLAYGGAAFSGTINTATLTADRSYTLPDVGGTFCLTSGNCLGGGGGGANTALSNLSSVAINTSLLPGAAGTINLGSATFPFGDLYIAGTSGTPGSNNFRVTGSATAARTITLPDASGTVCLNGAAACGFATGSGAAFLQNGNTFGVAGNLGTNDSNDLNLRTNGASRITIAANGSDATFASNMDLIMQGATAYITNSQGQTHGESFGAGATNLGEGVAVGYNSSAFGGGVAVGARATTFSTAGTAVGTDSNAGYLGTALGNSAQAAQEGTALGYSSVVGAHNSIAIGNSATVNQQFSIAIGQGATTTATNQMVIGATGYQIDHIYVGAGVTSATPTDFTLQGTGGTGTNVAGANVSITGGAGTGNANGGNVNIRVATPGGSGSSANVPATVLSLSGANGSALFKNTANSATALEVQTSGGTPVFTVNTSTAGVAVGGTTSSTGNINSSGGGLQTAGTTRVDNTGNLVSIGNITGSAATTISAGGTLTVGATGQILALQGNASSTFAVTGGGFTTTVGFTGTPTGAVAYNFDRAAAAGTYMVCTTAGNCLGGGAGGANTSLSNLTGVAINTSLLPGAAGTINLGSGTLPFGDFYLAGTSGTPGTNNFKFTGAATAARTITIPDAGGTICLQSAAACGFAPTSGSANYIQNQIGSNQAADFQISGSGRAATLNATTGINTGAVGGTQRIDASGNMVNIGNLTATGAITIASTGAGNDVIIDGADQFIVQDTSAFNNNVTISGQAADALIVKSSGNGSGVVVLNVQQNDGDSAARITDTGTIAAGNGTNIAGILAIAKGTGSLFGELHADNITGSRTLQFPDVSGTICTDAGNCGSATGTLQTAYIFSAGGTTPEIKLDGTRNGIDIQDANGVGIGSGQNFISFRGPNAGGLGSILFGVGTQGNLFMQPSADRTDLFDINNNAGNNIFTIDSATSNGRVGIGLGGSTLPAYTLDVAGDANLTSGSAFRINGTSICTSSGCTPAAGSGNYIQNQNTGDQTSANFRISGTGRANTSIVTPLLDTASAVALDIGASSSGINLNQNTTVSGTKTFTVNGGLASLNAGVTAAGGAVQLNASSNNNTTINTGTSTGTVGIGNSLAGTITIQSGSTIGITTTNFNVSTAGVVTLAGSQTADITTAAVNTANGTGKSLTLAAGDETSGTCGTACTGGAIAIQGGNATGGAGTRNGGAVNIDGGTGNTGNGAINIGTINSSNITIGKTTGGSTTTLQAGVGGVNIGIGGVANTIQIGNTTGAVSQTVNIGNNATASSTSLVTIGSNINANNNVTIDAGNTGGIFLGSSSTAHSIYMGTSSSAAQAVNIGSFNASSNTAVNGTTVSVGATGLSGNDSHVEIASAFGGTQYAYVGSSTTAANSLHLEAGNTGGLYIGGTNDSHTIHIGDSASGVQTLSIGSGNSTSALTLQSGSVGTSILSTGNVTVGTVDANGTLLVVDTKNTAGDPTGVNGAMYYNSNAGKFRCYQAGSWADCIAASGGFVSLQNAYTNSTGGTTSEIIVDNTRNALDIQDRSTSNGGSIAANLFNIRATAANDSTAGSLLFGVSSTGSVTIAQNLTMQGASSYISNPQSSFAAGESFGLNASVGTAVGSTAIGNGALAPNNRSVALGRLSNAAGDDGLAIGYQATLTNNGGTAIGSGTTAGFGSIALGFSANASNNNAIAINGITTANNQMVIGASGGAVSQVVIGSGVTAASPTGFTLQGTSGSGSNIVGASMTLAGGQSTGNANGGAVNIQVSGAGGAGASLNGLTTVATFDAAAGVTLGTATLNTPVTIDSGTGTIGIGTGAQARTINLGTGAAVVQTIGIGGTGANVIGVGNTQTAGSVNLGAAMTTGTINIGGAAQTGTLTLGRSTATNIINIGNATTATGNTQTVNIATSATGTGLAAVTMGNGNGASSMVLQAGTGGMQLTTQGTGALAIGNNAVAQAINIGNGTGGTAVSVLCGTGTCGFGNNITDHSTTVGSLTGTSVTNLQGGTGGLTVATASLGAINTGTVTIKSGNSAATAGNVNIDTGNTVTGTPTINIGTGFAKSIFIGNNSSPITIDGGSGTINIGTTASAHTVNMGTGAGAMTVNVGSTASTSTTTIQGGTGNINLLTNAANASIIAKSGTNGLAAFQVQDSGSVAYLTVNTSTSPGTYIAGAGTGGGGSKVYLGPVGDTSVYIGEQGATDTNILEMNALVGYSFLTGATPTEALGVTQNGYTKVTSLNDSFGGFAVQQSTGNQTFIVGVGDAGSNHGEVRVGNNIDDIYATPLVLDTKTNAGDPTGVNGAMYYNSNAAAFRCYENGAWKNCITGAGAGLAKNAMDTSSAAVTAANYLYGFTNSSSAVASGVLSLNNGTNTNSTLNVTASGNPTAGQALIFASNTNASPTGNLIDLQAGSSPVSLFSVSGAGTVNVGAVGSSTIASTIHIADTTGTGLQAVSIGSAGNASNSVAILAGNTGSINIGSVGSSTLTSSVHIADTGDATGNQNVFIGNTAGTATKVTIKGGGSSGFLKLNVGTSGTIGIGDASPDAALNLGTTMTTGTITLGGAVAQTGTIIVGQSTGTNTVRIGDGTGATTVQIGTGVTSAKTIQIGTGAAISNTITLGGTGANVITMGDTQAAGSVSIGSAMTTGTITLGGAVAQTGTIILGQSTGTNTVRIGDGTGATTIQIGTGITNAKTLQIGTGAAMANTINIGGTGANVIALGNTQTAGSISLGAAMTTGTITLGGAVAQTGTIIIGQSTGTNSVRIGDGTGATTVQIGTGVTNAKTIQIGTGAAMANTISIGGTGANVITLGDTQTAGSISLGAAMTTGTVNIGGTGAQTGTIGIGTGTGVQTLNFGTGGTGAKTVTVGSSASTGLTTIQSGTLGISLLSTGNIKIGTSDTTGTLLVLDTKTDYTNHSNSNSEPTGVAGGMYYNSGLGQFRCYEIDHWRDCLVSARTVFKYVNDYIGTAQDNVMQVVGTGTGAGGTSTAGSTGHPGQVTLSTGTTATGSGLTGANDNGTPFLLGNGDYWRFETELQVPLLSNNDATNTYLIKAGMTDGGTAVPTDGCWFSYTHSVNAGKWQGNCANNTTTSTCDTTITVAINTWYRLTFVANAAGTSVDFQVNGTSLCQVTTNIPTTAGRETSMNISILKTASTTARTMLIDYLDLEGQFGSAR